MKTRFRYFADVKYKEDKMPTFRALMSDYPRGTFDGFLKELFKRADLNENDPTLDIESFDRVADTLNEFVESGRLIFFKDTPDIYSLKIWGYQFNGTEKIVKLIAEKPRVTLDHIDDFCPLKDYGIEFPSRLYYKDEDLKMPKWKIPELIEILDGYQSLKPIRKYLDISGSGKLKILKNPAYWVEHKRLVSLLAYYFNTDHFYFVNEHYNKYWGCWLKDGKAFRISFPYLNFDKKACFFSHAEYWEV